MKAFTLIEIIIVMLVIGIIGITAAPKLLDIARDARIKNENSAVGNIRTGIDLVQLDNRTRNISPAYPAHIDSANTAPASISNPLFGNVLRVPITNAWEKTATDRYKGPTGSEYEYDPATGTFETITTPNPPSVPPGFTAVSSLEQFLAIADNLTGNYALTADIDLSDSVNWNGGAGYLPIGTPGSPFTGTFDGQGHTIKGLYVNRPSSNYVGLFGYANGATIKNVGLVDNTITGKDYVGGVAGYSVNGTTITKSYVSGNVQGQSGLGGITGWNQDSSIIDSYVTGNVSGTGSAIGGLTSVNRGSSARIINSYVKGNVTTSWSAAGLTYENSQGGTIINSYFTGSVTVGQHSAAGLVYVASGSSIINSGWYDAPADSATSAVGIVNYSNVDIKYTEPDPSAFYNQSHGVYDQGGSNPWDFTNTWQANANNFPTLREQ